METRLVPIRNFPVFDMYAGMVFHYPRSDKRVTFYGFSHIRECAILSFPVTTADNRQFLGAVAAYVDLKEVDGIIVFGDHYHFNIVYEGDKPLAGVINPALYQPGKLYWDNYQGWLTYLEDKYGPLGTKLVKCYG